MENILTSTKKAGQIKKISAYILPELSDVDPYNTT